MVIFTELIQVKEETIDTEWVSPNLSQLNKATLPMYVNGGKIMAIEAFTDTAPIALERTNETTQNVADALALLALDAELDADLQSASDATKQKLTEHLDEAKSVTGGRGYEFATVVDRGHTTRLMGGAAVTGAFGLGQRPYGMPFMGTRQGYNNPYISRNSVRY